MCSAGFEASSFTQNGVLVYATLSDVLTSSTVCSRSHLRVERPSGSLPTGSRPSGPRPSGPRQAANFRGADFRAGRVPEADRSSSCFFGPKYVGVANLRAASVSGLMLSRRALDEALINGVDLSEVIGLTD